MAPAPITWAFASRSDVGRVRTANEDAFLVDAAQALAVVCDGMGGHACGEIASALAAEAIAEAVRAAPRARHDEALLRQALIEASARVRGSAAGVDAREGMGTTAVAALFHPDRVAIAWAGDSRAYRYRDGALVQRTVDHSLLQEFIDLRQPSAEAIARFPWKSVITRFLGDEAPLVPESLVEAPAPGDRWLLCTDGLTNLVDDEGIAAILAAAPDADEACRRLVEAANAAGGTDNVTVVLAVASGRTDPQR